MNESVNRHVAFHSSVWDEGGYCVTGIAPGEQPWEDTPLWGFVLADRDAKRIAAWLNSLSPEYMEAMAKLLNITAKFNRALGDDSA